MPQVREFTRHTAYNKHDTGWAKGAPSEDRFLWRLLEFLRLPPLIGSLHGSVSHEFWAARPELRR